MSELVEGVWRFDLEPTLRERHGGIAAALMKPWDFEDRFGFSALAFGDGKVRSIRLVDGLHGVAEAVTIEDRAFGDAWMRLGDGSVAVITREGDDEIVIDDDNFRLHWRRAPDVAVDWSLPGEDDNATRAGPPVSFCGQTLWRDDQEVECVDHPEVTDVAPLAALPWLRALDLTGSGVSDLDGLRELERLVDVDLRRTKVRDLSPLRASRFLHEIDLGGTPVTDLSPLHGARWLRVVKLDGTQVSREAVAALEASAKGHEEDKIYVTGCRSKDATPCDRSDDAIE